MKMEGTLLSPTEQQFYSDWFSSCDQENSGKLMGHQVSKLFVSSQLNPEDLQKITVLCGAYRVGHFGRSQFFLALKLIAMVQNGYQIPSSIEGLYSGIEVPLPKFTTSRSSIVDQAQAKKDNKSVTTDDKSTQPTSAEMRQMEFVNPAFMDHTAEFEPTSEKTQNRQPGQLPAPPSKSHVRNASSGGLAGLLQPRLPTTQGSGSSENSPSSTPPLVDDPKVMSPRSKTMDRMHSVPAPTHRKLDRQASIPTSIPARPEEGWANFTHQPPENAVSVEPTVPVRADIGQGTSPERSDGVKDAGEQNGQENIWQISEEQRQYYTEQFRTLQPDISGLIQGNEAKQFFEKSKLPTTELSKIWQLSDVNKDGALCLEEFCTAMHLSVLRKHKYELPDKLPQCLIPKIDDGSTMEAQEAEVSSSTAPTKKMAPPPPDVTNRSVTPSGLAVEVSPKANVTSGENWAKFSDSPFPGPSPSTEGPANFDFASISPDPESKIVQPIPLKLAPDGQTCILPIEPTRPRKYSDPGSVTTPDDEEHLIPFKQRSLTMPDPGGNTPARIAPPPPVDRKASAPTLDLFAGDNVIGLIPRHRPRRGLQRSHSSSGIRTKHGQQPASVAFIRRAKFQQKRTENRQSWEGVLDFEPNAPFQPVDEIRGNIQTHANNVIVKSQSFTEYKRDPRAPPEQAPKPDCNQESRPDLQYDSVLNTKPNTNTESNSESKDVTPPEIPVHPNAKKTPASTHPPPIPPVPAKPPPVKIPPRVSTYPRYKQQKLVRSATVGHSARLLSNGKDSVPDSPRSPPQIPPRPTENKKNSVSSRNSSSLYSSSDYNSSNSSDEDADDDDDDEHLEEKTEEPKLIQNFADFSRFENESTQSPKHKYMKSMSLDYRLMGRQKNSQENVFPPVPPPRPVLPEFREVIQETTPRKTETTQQKERHASGDLLSRTREEYAKDRTRHQSAPLPIHVQNLKSYSRKSIQDKIRKIKEENTKLSRLNTELQQELKELTQDRIGLEVQLNKLKPFSTS